MMRAGSLRDDAILLLLMMVWGTNPTWIKIGLREIDPLALTMLRNAIGLVLLIFVFALTERRMPRLPADIRRVLVIAVVGVTLNQLLFNLAVRYTFVANISLIGSTSPIFGLILARILEGERSSYRRWFGVALGLLGVAAMIRGGLGEFGFGSETLVGDLLMLCATVALTLQGMLGRPLLKSMSAVELTLVVSLIGIPLLIPFTLPAVIAQSWSTVSALAWLTAVGSAVIIIVVIVFMYRFVAKAAGSRFFLFMYLTPVSGVLAGMVVLRETLSLLQIVGAAAVLLGVTAARKN